jgi:hypothetical protein
VASKAPVRLHPLAEQEALVAFRWYAERNALVADIFVIALAHHRRRPGYWVGRS